MYFFDANAYGQELDKSFWVKGESRAEFLVKTDRPMKRLVLTLTAGAVDTEVDRDRRRPDAARLARRRRLATDAVHARRRLPVPGPVAGLDGVGLEQRRVRARARRKRRPPILATWASASSRCWSNEATSGRARVGNPCSISDAGLHADSVRPCELAAIPRRRPEPTRSRPDPRQPPAPPMRIAVVTSSPPLTEGGHMVIARSLVAGAARAPGIRPTSW